MKHLAVSLMFAVLVAYVLLSSDRGMPWLAHFLVGLAWVMSLGVIHEIRPPGSSNGPRQDEGGKR